MSTLLAKGIHCKGSEARYHPRRFWPILNKYSTKYLMGFFFYTVITFALVNWHTRLMISHEHNQQKAIHSLHTNTSLTTVPISHLALAINKRKLLRGCSCRLISSQYLQ